MLPSRCNQSTCRVEELGQFSRFSLSCSICWGHKQDELGLGAVFAILEMFLPNSSSGFRNHYFKWKTFFLPVAQELRHLERRHIWTFQYPEQDDFPLPFGTLRSFIQFSFLWIDPGKMWFPQFSIRHLLKRTPKKYFLPKKHLVFMVSHVRITIVPFCL